MKNFTFVSSKLIVGVLTVIVAASFAVPAFADTTTAGYYDQFGNFHVYQTYTPPSSYYGGGNVYYGNSGVNQYGGSYLNQDYVNRGYSTYGVDVVSIGRTSSGAASSVATYGKSANSGVAVGSGSGVIASNSSKGKTTGSETKTAYGLQVGSGLLGGKKTVGKLEITNIVVTSGPLNIYEDKTDVNCDVSVSWDSGVPTAGQVVYGTVSQANIDSFSYQSVSPEGNSLTKSHSVKLGCLDNTTYYFRIVAFTNTERVVSDEQVIFPIKIRTQIPVVGATSGSDNGASILNTLGKIVASPIVLIIALGVIAYLIVSRIFRGKGASAQAVPTHAEPELLIPHH